EPSTAFYHSDGNGNITCLIDTNQLVVGKYLYDPYGNTLSLSGSLASVNRYRFSSKEWNENSGLYYYLYRFYDPNLQRWLNRDPLGENGFESIRHKKTSVWGTGPNPYVFLKNSAVFVLDSWGLDAAA